MRVSNVNLAKWTPEADEVFTSMHMAGASYTEIAEHFGTSLSAIERRRVKLGLPSPTKVKEDWV